MTRRQSRDQRGIVREHVSAADARRDGQHLVAAWRHRSPPVDAEHGCGGQRADRNVDRIVAGGGRKYTAGNIDRTRYDRLVDLGWLTPFKTNISDVEYQVTEKGRAASLDNADD